jgi:hypothetical protein
MTPEVGLPVRRNMCSLLLPAPRSPIGRAPTEQDRRHGMLAAQYPPGGPPPYGGPPPPSVYPGGQGGYPGGQPGYPGGPYGAPPPSPGGSPYGGGYPPPVQPPRKSNRGVLFGVGGAIVIVLAAVCGVFFIKGRSGADATATPAFSATVANASAILGGIIGPKPGANATPTPTAPNAPPARSSGGGLLSNLSAAATARAIGNPGVATNAPSPTPAPTTNPATASPQGGGATATRPTGTGSAPSGTLTTFTDPKGFFKFQYPATWAVQSLNANDRYNVLIVAASDGAQMYVDIVDPQEGSLDVEIQGDRDNDAKSTRLTFTDGPVTDTRIGGEPAKTYIQMYARKENPNSAKTEGQVWEVNHGGREFYFSASITSTHRAEFDAMIASVTFTTAAAGGQLATFTDPKGLVRLQYPNTWVASMDSSDTHNVLTLQSPDGTGFYLDIFDPQDGTIDQELQEDRDFRTKSQNFTNTLGNVTETKIGGEPAKTYTYSYVRKDAPNGQKFDGQDWEVNHGGRDFSFSTSPVGSHRAEIDAIIASVTYLK